MENTGLFKFITFHHQLGSIEGGVTAKTCTDQRCGCCCGWFCRKPRNSVSRRWPHTPSHAHRIAMVDLRTASSLAKITTEQIAWWARFGDRAFEVQHNGLSHCFACSIQCDIGHWRCPRDLATNYFHLSLSRSPVRVRDYGPVKDTGRHNSTNQGGFARTVHKISQRWTTRKLRVQPATSCHYGGTLKKTLSKCHPNVLMDGHVSSEVYKQNSTPNSTRDSRKQI